MKHSCYLCNNNYENMVHQHTAVFVQKEKPKKIKTDPPTGIKEETTEQIVTFQEGRPRKPLC